MGKERSREPGATAKRPKGTKRASNQTGGIIEGRTAQPPALENLG